MNWRNSLLSCHVIRNSLRLCCVDQSGTSIQILQEQRDTFFIKLQLYKFHLNCLDHSISISLLLRPSWAGGSSGLFWYRGAGITFFSGRLLTSSLSLQLNNTHANACKYIYLFSCQIILRTGAYRVLLFWRPGCTNTVKSQARSESCIYVLRKPAT